MRKLNANLSSASNMFLLCRTSDVHVVQLLFGFPPVDGRAGGVGPSNFPLAERRHQQHVQGPVHVRQTTQPLLQMDSRRYFHTPIRLARLGAPPSICPYIQVHPGTQSRRLIHVLGFRVRNDVAIVLLLLLLTERKKIYTGNE